MRQQRKNPNQKNNFTHNLLSEHIEGKPEQEIQNEGNKPGHYKVSSRQNVSTVKKITSDYNEQKASNGG